MATLASAPLPRQQHRVAGPMPEPGVVTPTACSDLRIGQRDQVERSSSVSPGSAGGAEVLTGPAAEVVADAAPVAQGRASRRKGTRRSLSMQLPPSCGNPAAASR